MFFVIISLAFLLIVGLSIALIMNRRKKRSAKKQADSTPPQEAIITAPATTAKTESQQKRQFPELEPAKIMPPASLKRRPGFVSNRVLVIEDDPIMLMAIKKILEKEGHVITIAKDGKEGFDELSKGTYDIVITDLMLPFANGLEIVNRITADAAKRDIGIIVCSSVRHDDTIKEVHRLGVDYFINKPISAEELATCIQDLSAKRLEKPKLVIRKTKMVAKA